MRHVLQPVLKHTLQLINNVKKHVHWLVANE